ncbi:hypothetical protein HY635_02225 [Candidatus Uhrbacteria bacterium]|nr:hypothetical protein [Candidatus Uhrbacteria bacterium]
MDQRLRIVITTIGVTAASCGVDTSDDRAPTRDSDRHTWTSGEPTSSAQPTPSEQPTIECREDFDCCANPNVPCGRACANGTCVDADPGIDLSVEASWHTEDLLALPDGTPTTVRTVLNGFTTTDLPAVLRGFVENPITTDSRDPYLLLETDTADERWVLTNGPAAGMSGSPIIINGRLAGALSFSVGDTVAPFLFVATPIEKMLAIDATSLDVTSATGAPGGTPLSAVLTVPSGAAEWFTGTGWFDDRFIAIPDDALGGIGAGDATDAGPLVPGSAIAVLLITGDILNIGGIGTVTAVDGDRVWAFGHPMTQAGPTAFPFSAAEVMAVAGNPLFGAYKIASPAGPLLGAITNDRTAAIAGQFGALPPMVTARTDSTYLGVTQETHHQTALVADPFGTAQFAAFALVWPITVQRDLVSSGSIAYDLTVTVGETDLVGRRRDIISTPSWVEADLFYDLFYRLANLIGNQRVPLTLARVELTADVSDDRLELTIDDIEFADRIEPGDELVVAVRLLPFGSTEPVTEALVLEVPSDFPTGPATLNVGPETMVGEPEPVRPDGEDADVPDTAEEIIAAFNAQPRKRVLVAQLTSMVSPMLDGCPPPSEPPAEEPPAEEMGGGGGVPAPPSETCSAAPNPDEPPPPPPHVRVAVELDAVVDGFEAEQVEVSAAGGP